MSQFIQDHKAVVIGNKKVAQANAAKSGEAKKPGSTGLNGKLDNQTASKLDDNEVKAPKTVGIEVGQAIQRARASKKLKVDQLANEMALTKSIITDLESGQHKMDNKLLQRLEKKLGVWLTGASDRIGTPKTREEAVKLSSATNGATSKPKKDAKASKAEQTEEKGLAAQASAADAVQEEMPSDP